MLASFRYVQGVGGGWWRLVEREFRTAMKNILGTQFAEEPLYGAKSLFYVINLALTEKCVSKWGFFLVESPSHREHHQDDEGENERASLVELRCHMPSPQPRGQRKKKW